MIFLTFHQFIQVYTIDDNVPIDLTPLLLRSTGLSSNVSEHFPDFSRKTNSR
jgi:hypothetical protein